MLELNQRWIHFYGITLESVPDDAPSFDIAQCMTMLKRHFRTGNLFRLIDKEKACVRISDMRVSAKSSKACVLFHYADSRLSDPAFSDLKSGSLRSEPKMQGEGVAVSAHAAISLKPIKDGGLEFLMLLEDVPGIGKTKLVPFLNYFMKKLLSREVITEEGARINSYPIFCMDHFASQSLQEDLESGELKFVELIKNKTIKELDEDPYIDRIQQAVRIKAAPKTSGVAAIDFINRIKRLGKENSYYDMRVVFNKPEGKQRSVKVQTFREDAGEVLFGKMEVITTEHDLEQCAPAIDDLLMQKMITLLDESNHDQKS